MTTYRGVVLADAPDYYWGLDDALGSVSYASVISGGPTLAPSGTINLQQQGLALGYDNACAKFQSGSFAVSSTAALSTDVLALEAIINTTTSSAYIIGHATDTAYDRMMYIGSSGRLIFGVYGTTRRTVVGSSVVSDGKTHHVVARIASGGAISVWVDGVKEGEATYGPAFFSYSPKVYIARSRFAISSWTESDGTYMPFDGFIDEPAVYHGGLSDASIARHAQVALRPSRLAGKALLDSGSPATRVLARNWDTDQTAGSAVPGVGGTWQIYVAPGNYEVSFRGPVGYQPVTHGPVVAVSEV